MAYSFELMGPRGLRREIARRELALIRAHAEVRYAEAHLARATARLIEITTT